MNRITLLIAVFTIALSPDCLGQSTQNPFELLFKRSHRPTPISKSETEPIDTTTKLSEDTLSLSSESLIAPTLDTPTLDTVAFPIAEQSPETEFLDTTTNLLSTSNEIMDSAFLDLEAMEDTTGRNPFDYSEAPEFATDITLASKLTEDSLVTKTDEENRSEKTPKSLSTDDQNGQKISGAFLALIFLGIFLLLTIIVNINRGLLNKIYRASLNENFSALLYRERKHSALNYLYPVAYAIFFINIGLFLYLIQFLKGTGFEKQYALWLLILIPIGIYSIRHTVMGILAHVFPISKEINQFNFNIIVFNIMIGLILIPINLFIAFGPDILHMPLLYVTLFIFVAIYVFRQLRGFLISSTLLSKNLFLFFIYLCTVEILPIAVIVKLLV